VGDIQHVHSRKLALDTKVPVIARCVSEIHVKQHWSKRPHVRNRVVVRDHSCRKLIRRSWQRKWAVDTAPIESIDRIEGKGIVVLLERRIATGIPKQISEHTIMKNSKSSANSGLAVTPWIPS